MRCPSLPGQVSRQCLIRSQCKRKPSAFQTDRTVSAHPPRAQSFRQVRLTGWWPLLHRVGHARVYPRRITERGPKGCPKCRRLLPYPHGLRCNHRSGAGCPRQARSKRRWRRVWRSRRVSWAITITSGGPNLHEGQPNVAGVRGDEYLVKPWKQKRRDRADFCHVVEDAERIVIV